MIGLDTGKALDKEAFKHAMADSPTLVVLNHASNVTGRVNPVETLFAEAKKRGAITLLDAAQSLGNVPLSVKSCNADMIAFTGHKGLHGPPGTGGLYVDPKLDLEQIYVGGTGVRSDLMLHPPDMPMRLEAGTPNAPAFAGLAAALQWHQKHGATHAQTAMALGDRLRNGLKEVQGVTVFDADEHAQRTSVVSFRVQGWDVEELGFILAESFGIIGRSGLHCAPLIHQAIGSAPEGTVRLSASGFNTEDEIDFAIQSIRKLAS